RGGPFEERRGVRRAGHADAEDDLPRLPGRLARLGEDDVVHLPSVAVLVAAVLDHPQQPRSQGLDEIGQADHHDPHERRGLCCSHYAPGPDWPNTTETPVTCGATIGSEPR